MKKSSVPVILLLLFLLKSPAIGQSLTSEQIDSIVNKSMSLMPLAGMAVAVVKNGEVIHSKGYGVTSVSSKEKVNEHTLFAIASNTKAFTTAALAMLVDVGKLNWNDKVVDYIPEFKMYDPYVTADFNIQDLLTHRSGLGLGAGDLMFFPDGSDFTVTDVLKSFQYQTPVSAFRTKFDYDNLLYVVAGEVVARVSGLSWADFVESKIMRPIGMDRSAGVYQRVNSKDNIANPHDAESGKLVELNHYTKNDESLGAAGGIYASVDDLTNWLLLHLNNGKYGKNLDNQLISESNHRELWKPQTNISFNAEPSPPYRTHFQAYALGWIVQDQAGYIVIEHTGGLPGMLSRTILIPELNVGIIVLTNTAPGGYSFRTVASAIADGYLGIEKTDWISLAQERLQASQSESDSVILAVWNVVAQAYSGDMDFKNFVGTYRDNWFGDIEIWLENEKLWFKSLRSPKLTGEMFYYQANTFAIKWNYQDMPCDAFAIFNLDENGSAISIKMKGISPNIDFSFDFQDLDLKRVKESNKK